ncbi:MAG: PocR ligand-binding domain-containing protein [Lachnospiraceae bacterium]|nr:PocR ligand-binding domain-containing protein [Lachnospiraceae bacterium]
MVSTFNISKLKKLLQSYYILTGIRITVFDENFQEIVAYPAKIPLFCTLIRQCPSGLEHCKICDQAACQQVNQLHRTYTYRCHAGLTESITPIVLGEIVIGYLLFGHIAPEPQTDKGWVIVRECCKDYDVDMDMLESAYSDRKYFANDYIEAASELMNAVASYLCISHLAAMKHDSLPYQIDRYIQAHISEDMSSQRLCEQFEISRTKLYQISTENFGMGITEYIRKNRIDRASQLLETTSLPISQIADAVGISDYNYFTKVFKSLTGITPREYKRLHSQQ